MTHFFRAANRIHPNTIYYINPLRVDYYLVTDDGITFFVNGEKLSTRATEKMWLNFLEG